MRPNFAKMPLAILSFFFLLSCQRDTSEQTILREPEGPSAILERASYASHVEANSAFDYTVRENELLATGWRKAFEEQFNNSDPATAISAKLSQWNIWNGGSFNNELQYYQGPNLQVENGNLVITAKRETITGATYPVDQTPKTFQFTSGRIESKTLFSAGSVTPKIRFVARIKLPRGTGMWPAFWSYGDPWPTQGEIDVLEARGDHPYQFETNYFYGREANVNLVRDQSGFFTTTQNLQEDYHIYEVVWTRKNLAFYLDGRLIETKSGGYISNLFNKKEKLVLNLAVGGNFFVGLDPEQIQTGSIAGITYGVMYVDWVKVFTSKQGE